MNDRGMKKWLPYKSLDEQYPYLERELSRHASVAKPTLLPDEEEKINDFLLSYDGVSPVKLVYHAAGMFHHLEVPSFRLDPYHGLLKTERQEIRLADITVIGYLEG